MTPPQQPVLPLEMPAMTLRSRAAAATALLLAASLQAGCVHLDPDRAKADFGSSNRVALRNQIADPEAAQNAGDALVTGLDGQKAGGVVRAYRGDNANRSFTDASVNTNSLTTNEGN